MQYNYNCKSIVERSKFYDPHSTENTLVTIRFEPDIASYNDRCNCVENTNQKQYKRPKTL